jgi:hypothetical protein
LTKFHFFFLLQHRLSKTFVTGSRDGTLFVSIPFFQSLEVHPLLPDGPEDETYNSFASKEMNSSSSFALGTSRVRMKHPYLFRLCGTEHNFIYYETFIGWMGELPRGPAPRLPLTIKLLPFGVALELTNILMVDETGVLLCIIGCPGRAGSSRWGTR